MNVMNHYSTQYIVCIFSNAGSPTPIPIKFQPLVRYRTNVGSRFRNSLSWKDEELRCKIQGDPDGPGHVGTL